MTSLAQNSGARVKMTVARVTESQTTERLRVAFRFAQERRNLINGVDLLQHPHTGFVRPTVGRSPQRREPGGDAGKEIRPGGARRPDGGRRCALAVVGVQHQDLVHRLLNHRIQLILFRRNSKQHMQEIPRIGKIVARILRRLLN